MAKESANMIAIRIIYKKQIIKAEANDLHIYTVVSCILYSHIHQSQQPFLSHCFFYGILDFLLKHTFSRLVQLGLFYIIRKTTNKTI